MKKIFTAAIIAIVSLISINMWGQITYSKPESKPYEKIVYRGRGGIYHYFSSDKYQYTVFSSNQFEDYQVHFNLGKGIEQAITSLENIIQMWDDANHGDRVSIGGYHFTVIKNCMVEIEYDYYLEGFWQTYYDHAGVYHMNIKDIKYFLEYLTTKCSEPTILTSDDNQESEYCK